MKLNFLCSCANKQRKRSFTIFVLASASRIDVVDGWPWPDNLVFASSSGPRKFYRRFQRQSHTIDQTNQTDCNLSKVSIACNMLANVFERKLNFKFFESFGCRTKIFLFGRYGISPRRQEPPELRNAMFAKNEFGGCMCPNNL